MIMEFKAFIEDKQHHFFYVYNPQLLLQFMNFFKINLVYVNYFFNKINFIKFIKYNFKELTKLNFI